MGKYLNRHLQKKTDKWLKSTGKKMIIISHSEIQIKTTTQYHFSSTKMAWPKWTEYNKCCGGCGEKGVSYVAGDDVKQRSHFGKQFDIFLKFKHKFTLWPRTSVHPREMKAYVHTKTCMWMFTALFVAAKMWKQSTCLSTGEWINKMWSILTMEYSATKRNELLIHDTRWTSKVVC